MSDAHAVDTNALSEKLLRLTPQPAAAVRLLRLVDDPGASGHDLARVVSADPALSARMIRLANSPYYGVSGRVGNASRAVVLLGFATVRALAVGAAAALLLETYDETPAGFWAHSVAAASSASALARHIGVNADDAFSVGLLHDIGALLLWPEHVRALGDRAPDSMPPDHEEAGARVLEAWRFPPSFVRAVAHHHHPETAGDTLTHIVAASEALALDIAPAWGHDEIDVDAALSFFDLDAAMVRQLSVDASREAEAIASMLKVK